MCAKVHTSVHIHDGGRGGSFDHQDSGLCCFSMLTNSATVFLVVVCLISLALLCLGFGKHISKSKSCSPYAIAPQAEVNLVLLSDVELWCWNVHVCWGSMSKWRKRWSNGGELKKWAWFVHDFELTRKGGSRNPLCLTCGWKVRVYVYIYTLYIYIHIIYTHIILFRIFSIVYTYWKLYFYYRS